MDGEKLDRRHEVRQTVFRQFHFIFFALPRVSHRNVNVNAPRAVVERSIRSNSESDETIFFFLEIRKIHFYRSSRDVALAGPPPRLECRAAM